MNKNLQIIAGINALLNIMLWLVKFIKGEPYFEPEVLAVLWLTLMGVLRLNDGKS